jgi:hypothetical protein
MIIAINYADSKFRVQQKYNTKTAYSKGKADKVIEYSPSDLDEDFVKKNNRILSYERGGGLWLWKPYLILKTLHKLNDGDYLFYCDAGAYYVNKIVHLVQALEKSKQSIMGFGLPLLERQFTKKETFVIMNCNNYDENQVMGGYILIKKDDFSIQFVKEWLAYASNEEIISPNYFHKEITEFEDYIAHREDQSIFSILYHKYNLIPFKEITQYGKRPWEHLWIPEYTWCKPWLYNYIEFSHSGYPQILVSCRDQNPKIYRMKECLKSFLNWLSIYNEKMYIRLKKAQK